MSVGERDGGRGVGSAVKTLLIAVIKRHVLRDSGMIGATNHQGQRALLPATGTATDEGLTVRYVGL